MIALAPLMLAAATAQAATTDLSAQEHQIIVLAQRLRAVDASVTQDKQGKWHCSLDGTSGTDWVDDRLCRTTTKCVQRYKLDRTEVQQCVAKDRTGVLAEFRRKLLEKGA